MRFATKNVLAALTATAFVAAAGSVLGVEAADTSPGDRMIRDYFRSETRKLADACLSDIETLDDWASRRKLYRDQLREMLGLDPLPERTPLAPVLTGTLDHADFTVEKLHFQSRPQLYVTANLYVPKRLSGPAPAILYVCGHGRAEKDGVSYGNKTKYQHHAGWFARNGYVCLVIDTVQLGEIEGVHHGTYRENMWWWNARGYTPAGIETWNSIRALDYLTSRPEVDAERIGVTGRSGGGAYTWWLAALDDRVKVAVPVAGITNLKNHVVDDCVEGHCDCMYFVNTHRWDFAQAAALVAPRPLLVSNTDHDKIFPLDGVMDVYYKLRRLYRLHGQPQHLGLHIAAGPHGDSQPLQVHAFQWLNRHLKGEDGPVDLVAERFFTMEELKVFDKLPDDAINSRIHETFTPAAPPPPLPESIAQWRAQSSEWRRALRENCFAGWPQASDGPVAEPQLREVFQSEKGSVALRAWDFESQNDITLRLVLVWPAVTSPAELEAIVLHPLGAKEWPDFLAAMRVDFAELLVDEPPVPPDAEKFACIQDAVSSGKRGLAFFAPRGLGPTAWDPDAEKHLRRRFMLLGQTVDGMRVWDTRRAIQAVRSIEGLRDAPLQLRAAGDMAGIALYAALFEPDIERLELRGLSTSHRHGPDFLNVLRILDVPQAVAMVAENTRVQINQSDEDGWEYPLNLAKKLGWKNRIAIDRAPK